MKKSSCHLLKSLSVIFCGISTKHRGNTTTIFSSVGCWGFLRNSSTKHRGTQQPSRVGEVDFGFPCVLLKFTGETHSRWNEWLFPRKGSVISPVIFTGEIFSPEKSQGSLIKV